MYRTVKELVLASASPRRSEMLSRLGLVFRVEPSGMEEGEVAGTPAAVAAALARGKAEEVARRVPPACVLGVDTIVVVDDRILGKPASREQAGQFLESLSGRAHQVISAYCLLPAGGPAVERQVTTKVVFKPLHDDEIAAYLETDEPYDKAGAYAVQGIGAFMVAAIEGSYTNVVGLPLTELVADLRSLGVIAAGRAG